MPEPAKKKPPAAPKDDKQTENERLEDLVPKHATVLVGSVKLVLCEPGMLDVAEAVQLVFDDGVSEGLRKLGAIVVLEYENREQYGSETLKLVLSSNTDTAVEALRGALLPLLAERGPRVAAILLDTAANRQRVEKEHEAGKLKFELVDRPDEPGAKYSPAFRAWVARALTHAQWDAFLGALSGMRGWLDLGKKLLGRVGVDLETIRETIRTAMATPTLPGGSPQP